MKKLMILCCLLSAVLTASAKWTVTPVERLQMQVLDGESEVFGIGLNPVGPGWTGPRLRALPQTDGDVRVYDEQLNYYKAWWAQEPMCPGIDFRMEVEKKNAKAFTLNITAQPEQDMDITGFFVFLMLSPELKGGRAVGAMEDGATNDTVLPPEGMGGLGSKVVKVDFITPKGHTVGSVAFDRPINVNYHNGQLRMWLVEKELKAAEPFETVVTVTTAEPFDFEADNRMVDIADWFEYENINDFSRGSVIGMEDWLDAPAGKHGWMKIDEGRFVFEDGTPVKFWAANTCHSHVACSNSTADAWAERCAKYGVNLFRFHKFVHPAPKRGLMQAHDTTKVDEEAARRFDYFNDALHKRGVYTGWSHIYRFEWCPADEERLPFFDELKKAPGFGALPVVNFVPEVQDLYIEATLNLLNRTNTVNGRRYATDPGLAYIELRNEDDIYLINLERQFENMPRLRRRVQRQYRDWLMERYGSLEAWTAAWGEVHATENLDEANIEFWRDQWYDDFPTTRRTADLYRFLFELQDTFYQRYAQALRDAGYRGALCGSCWQAMTFLGHLYNTYSDYRIGYIDRHNYASSPLNEPCAGLMSCGMQMVLDRPFGLSEWAGGSVYGGGESIPMVAVYGMGLQGWDYSAMFASDSPWIPNHKPGLGGFCHKFVNIAQFPALCRAIYRDDIEEGDVVLNRIVSVQGLEEGDPGFSETFNLLGGANNKEFKTVVPQSAMAAGRMGMEFVQGPVTEPIWKNVAPYMDEENRIIRSTTGQLEWNYSGRGYFTVDTPGTKGVVGFGSGKPHELGEVTIETETPYTLFYVSSLDRDAGIADAQRILVTALARTVDKDTVFDERGKSFIHLEPRYAGPLLIEPVRADVTIRRKGDCRIVPLDQEGRFRADAKEIKVKKTRDGLRFTVDTSRTKTIYYLVEFN